MKRVLLISLGCVLLAVSGASIYLDLSVVGKNCPTCDEPLEFRWATEYGDIKAETFQCPECKDEYRCLIRSDGVREWRKVAPEW